MRSKISDEMQWADDVARLLSRGMRTNFYSPAKEFFPIIAQGRLFREAFPGGVYYFVEKEGQTDCYFFLEKGALPGGFAPWDKPVLLEQVASARRGISPTAEEWSAVGFETYLQRKRLFLPAEEAQAQVQTVEFAEEAEADLILRWMQKFFEPYTSALPREEVLRQDLREKRVIAAREGEELLGFLRFGREKRVSVLWQIVVTPSGRGKGIGERLLKDWFALERGSVSKFQLWVREDNPSALRLYAKSGFQPDGRIAPVMIKNEIKK